MSWSIIPVPPSTSEITFTCAINGQTLSFHVAWNDRDESFYLDVSQTDGTPVINSVRLVLNAFLGRTSPNALFQTGVLMVFDTSGNYQECGIDDLGARVQLAWIPQTDLLAFALPAS